MSLKQKCFVALKTSNLGLQNNKSMVRANQLTEKVWLKKFHRQYKICTLNSISPLWGEEVPNISQSRYFSI